MEVKNINGKSHLGGAEVLVSTLVDKPYGFKGMV
jgi:hypothetical protein